MRRIALACAVGALVPAGVALAQSSGPGLRITPSFGADVSYLNTTGPGAGTVSSDDLVTQLRPGIHLESRSGRVRGTLDYQLSALYHTAKRTGSGPDIQNALSANFTTEVVEGFFYVDANANISQSVGSPYGVQTYDNTSANANRVELSTASIAPRFTGSIGGDFAVYNLAFNASTTHGRGTVNADSTNKGAVFSLNSPGGRLLGWGVQASTQESDFRAGRKTRNDRYSVSLNIQPDVDWYGSLRAGQESTNVLGLQRGSYSNYGADLRWTPSLRTTVSVSYDKRYFGNSYQAALEHRFARSSLRFTSVRGADDNSGATGTGAGVGQPISLYTLFYNQFSSIQPDPVLRDLLVRDFLRSQGLDPNLIVGGGFINSAVTLQRREDLAYSYTGVRNTFTLLAYSSRSQVLDPTGMATTNSGDVKQYGLTATLSHRLTPTASASFTASDLRTLSNGVQPSTSLRSLALSLNDQITRMVTASVSARFSDFNNATRPYRESSISAAVNVLF